MTIYGNSTGALQAGVQVYSAGGQALTAVSPTGNLQVVGNDGSGNIAAVTLTAGSNTTLTQTGTSYSISATTGGTSSGAIGVYSPVTQAEGTISSDIVVTTVYTSSAPALSAMQVISTATITCKYPNNGIGSVLQADAVVGFFAPAAQALGLQLCLYSSITGTGAPLDSAPFQQQGSCPNSYDNYCSSQLVAETPSSQGQTITFTLAASVQSGTTATIDASAFSFLVFENVPNTQSVVSSNSFALPPLQAVTAPYSSATQAYSTTTSILSTPYTKQYDNSSLVISGLVPEVGITPNSSYFSSIGLYIATSSQINASSPLVGFQGSGKVGAAISAPDGISTAVAVNIILGDAFLEAGSYTVAIGATYQYAQYFVQGGLGSILVNEVLPLADGGTIQDLELASFSTTSGTPYVSTISPQYSTVKPLGSWGVYTRAAGSKLIFTGNIGTNAITGNVEGEVIFCFYTSNLPTATPVFTARMSSPGNGTGSYNASTGAWRYIFPSSAIGSAINIYVGVASLTAANTVQLPYITAEFLEVYNGSVTSGVTSVTAASGSYLTSSTVSNAVTLGTTQASTTQAGLVALNASALANTIVRVNNSGAMVATAAPFYPTYGTSLVLAFGGASVGVTYTNRSGIAVYLNPYPMPTAATGQAAPLFVPTVQIIMNISSKGTSTGTATITGMPVIPFVPSAASTGIIPVERYQGISIPNNNRLGLQYVSGSSTLTFVQMPDNGGAAVALTNTAFTAPITFTATSIVSTLTAPTN